MRGLLRVPSCNSWSCPLGTGRAGSPAAMSSRITEFPTQECRSCAPSRYRVVLSIIVTRTQRTTPNHCRAPTGTFNCSIRNWYHKSLDFEAAVHRRRVRWPALHRKAGRFGHKLSALCVVARVQFAAPLQNVGLHVRVGEILERTAGQPPIQAFDWCSKSYDWPVTAAEGLWSPTPSFEQRYTLGTKVANLQKTSKRLIGYGLYISCL